MRKPETQVYIEFLLEVATRMYVAKGGINVASEMRKLDNRKHSWWGNPIAVQRGCRACNILHKGIICTLQVHKTIQILHSTLTTRMTILCSIFMKWADKPQRNYGTGFTT